MENVAVMHGRDFICQGRGGHRISTPTAAPIALKPSRWQLFRHGTARVSLALSLKPTGVLSVPVAGQAVVAPPG